MPRFIVEKVFYSLNKIPNFNYNRILENQLLIYICGEGGVGNSKIIHAIELGYTLLLQNFDLVITAPISTTVDNIIDSTIYISFAIGVKNRYRKSNIIFNLWTAWCIMIMDEISIVKLEILSNIEK